METTEPTKWKRLATIALVLCGGALLLLASSPSSTADTSPTPRRNLAGTPEECESTCKEPTFKDLQHFEGASLLDPAKLLERLKKSRKKWVDLKLRKDYGHDNYFNIFEPLAEVEVNGKIQKKRVSVGRNRIIKDVTNLPQYQNVPPPAPTEEEGAETEEEEDVPEHPAWDRFVQKLQMKILQIQLGILEERNYAKEICLDECGKEDEAGSRFLAARQSTGYYSKFTWATGGHSASAGHGNFFRESYTANMERALKPILKSVGLDFEARNYAMGGTDCAEEVSLCFNQIFGRDIDAISWDYGMTDGHENWKMTMYAYKAAAISKIKDSHSQPGNIPHRPMLVAIHQNTGHNSVVKYMHELGMTTLAHDSEYMKGVLYEALPDTFGMSDAEIAKMPPYVQYYKCEGKIESGDPGCGEHKFNNTICERRKARTSWHPGWKDHAMMGNLMAMTILDGLEDALQGLIELNAESEVPADEAPSDSKARLTKQLQGLDSKEKSNYENIFKSPIPEVVEKWIHGWWNGGKDEHLADIDIEAFYKEPSFCHSGILPSEARFKGLLTENFTQVGTILEQNYDTGVSSSAIWSTERPGKRSHDEPQPFVNPRGAGKLMLVKDESVRQVCEEHLNLDYKDYFWFSSMEEWHTITLPNDSEKKVYNEFDAKKAKGYILVCLLRCDWGRCPEGDLHSYFGWERPKPRKGEEEMSEAEIAKKGKVEMFINDQKVTEASDMHTCYALKNKYGHVWKPNADGRYELRMRVTGAEAYAYLRISSFIIV